MFCHSSFSFVFSVISAIWFQYNVAGDWASYYGTPLVPLLKNFLSGGHHIVIWWPPDKKYFLQWYQRGSVRTGNSYGNVAGWVFDCLSQPVLYEND